MNRIIKLNNYVNPISTKEIEFKINELYSSKNEVISTNLKTCRYCLEQDDREYISPCLCKGGMKYIHRDCLNQWREMHIFNPEKKNSCEICKYKYKFRKGNVEFYNKFLIKMSTFYIIHMLFIWFITMVFLWADIATNFFIIRTLNFYNYNNSSLLMLFQNYNKNEEVFYMTYTLFYFSFTSFLFEIYYVINFYLKCYKLFPNEHYKSIKCYMYRFNIQSFSFLYYYYFCLILNISVFYIYSTLAITVMNNIYRLQFYKKHNKLLKTIVLSIESTDEILSFEENPLLDYLNDIAEKKDPEEKTAEFDEYYNEYNSDSSNSSDSSKSSQENIIDMFDH